MDLLRFEYFAYIRPNDLHLPALRPALPEDFFLLASLSGKRGLLRFQRFHGREGRARKFLFQKLGGLLVIGNLAAMGGAERRFVFCTQKFLIHVLSGKVCAHVVNLLVDFRQLRVGFPQGCGSGAITRLRPLTKPSQRSFF